MNERVITEEMVTRAYEILTRDGMPPYMIHVRDFSNEDIQTGKFREAVDEAERKNRTVVRLALESAYLMEGNSVYDANMNKVPNTTGLEKIRQAWDDNPLVVIGVISGACMAVAKIIDAVSSAQGRRAYAKQVNMKAKRRS